ncbi:UPF0428 protein CXorf56 [Thelohanellus kitauei]|uniref:STING ER exit protein n=1 Tax=Thelohanellus kitauei TaxID=669202 RepID=A0A0C2MK70_THEKT|nr:UPF0428 protein CXorf56 [Thelohanellus kitauei]
MKTTKSSIETLKKPELTGFDLSEWPYNCVCDHLVLVLDVCISSLPLRPKDHSRVFENSRIIKIDYTTADTVYIQRDNGIEAQIRLECPKLIIIDNTKTYEPSTYNEKSHESAQTSSMVKFSQSVPSAYSYNAALITDYLQKKRPNEEISDSATKKKKLRGTLLDI